MTDPTTPTRNEALEALGREYADLAAVKAATDARMDEIKAAFREALDYGPPVGIANLSVQIGRNVTRDNEKFMADYPREQNPDLYVDALNTKAINKEFAPATLEQYQILGAPRVTVKVLEDVTE